MADLVALPYMSEVFCATSNGNIAKTVAMNVIWFSLGMIIVSQFCPAMTQIAIEQGVNLADYNAAGVSIVSFGVLCHPFIVGLFCSFLVPELYCNCNYHCCLRSIICSLQKEQIYIR